MVKSLANRLSELENRFNNYLSDCYHLKHRIIDVEDDVNVLEHECGKLVVDFVSFKRGHVFVRKPIYCWFVLGLLCIAVSILIICSIVDNTFMGICAGVVGFFGVILLFVSFSDDEIDGDES